MIIDKIIKIGIVERAKRLNEFKTKSKLSKTTDGKKNKKIYGKILTIWELCIILILYEKFIY